MSRWWFPLDSSSPCQLSFSLPSGSETPVLKLEYPLKLNLRPVDQSVAPLRVVSLEVQAKGQLFVTTERLVPVTSPLPSQSGLLVPRAHFSEGVAVVHQK